MTEINHVFDVKKNFGAKGDDSTNDTAAVQAAFDAVGPGDIVYVPRGTYLVKDLVIPNVNNWGLVGDVGQENNWTLTGGSTFKALDNTVSYLAAAHNYVNNVALSGRPLRIANMRFDGDNNAQDCLILMNFQSTVEGITCHSATRDGMQWSANTANGTDSGNNITHPSVYSSSFHHNGRYGFLVRSDNNQSILTDGNVDNCFIYSNTEDGMRMDPAGGWHIESTRFFSNGHYDLDIARSFADLRIHNNVFGGNATQSITEWGVSQSREAAVFLRALSDDSVVLFTGNTVLGHVAVQAGSGSGSAAFLSALNNYNDTDSFIWLNNTTRVVVSSIGDIFTTTTPFRSNTASGGATFHVTNDISIGNDIDKPLDGTHIVVGSSIPIKTKNELKTVASATTISGAAHRISVTGSTNIETINDGHTGQELVVVWAAGATFDVVDTTGNILLAGSANLTTATAGSTLTLLYDGTNWLEKARSII